MSKKKQARRAARALRQGRTEKKARAKLAMALASNQVTIYARLITLQKLRLETTPPEDAVALAEWLADYEALWEQYPDLTDDEALWPPKTCKEIAEGSLQDLHDRAAEMGATISLADKVKVQRSGTAWVGAA